MNKEFFNNRVKGCIFQTILTRDRASLALMNTNWYMPFSMTALLFWKSEWYPLLSDLSSRMLREQRCRRRERAVSLMLNIQTRQSYSHTSGQQLHHTANIQTQSRKMLHSNRALYKALCSVQWCFLLISAAGW